jgi:hypothetical protein
MVKRQCYKCKTIFDKKSTYDYHINRKTECKPDNIDLNEEKKIICENLQIITNNTNNAIFCCSYCQKNFSTKYTLERHINEVCKVKKTNDEKKTNITKLLLEKDKENKDKIKQLEKQNKLLIDKNNNSISKNNEIVKIHKTIKKLESTIPANTNLTISNQYLEKIIQKDKEIEELIIKHTNKKENKIDILDIELDELLFGKGDQIDKNDNIDFEDNKPMTLILNNDVIECRKSDGYINATQLCKAGGKKFNDWLRLENTKNYLVSLEVNTGIPALELIDKNIGGNHSGTWIYPKVAIYLAQCLSPEFAVQVSNWIYDLMTKGKVEVNIKLLKEQENIIKNCKNRIKHLEDRILKKQPRPKYDNSKFVVYLASNKNAIKERKYTIGLASDLSKRISNYDKLEDHKVIYYKAFGDEKQMELAEGIVLNKLYEYREKESKDRFILPIGKDIQIFTKPIDDAVNFFNN